MIRLLLTLFLSLAACDMMSRQDIKKQDEERQMREQLAAMQKGKADTDLRYSDLQNDIRVVAGRVDTLDHALESNKGSTRQEIEALRKQVEMQNEKLKALESHLSQTEQRLMAAIQGAPVAAPQSGAAPVPEKKDTADVFEEAEALLKAKEFKKAIVKYQAFRDKNSKGVKAAEATYKIGVCFAELGMKKDAREFYLETIENFPSTKAASKAKYRLSNLK
ncbi:MAG: tetratricopeptide repeat protein [Oligoflexia bacterium]|nr:tetratricopeptide repeat protein [Oligoflexia bacterium]